MNLKRKIGIGILSVASLFMMTSCNEEDSSDAYYYYSTYEVLNNCNGNNTYYSFYVSILEPGNDAFSLETKKEDFKVSDTSGSYSPIGFISELSSSTRTVDGVRQETNTVKLADTFTFKKTDGAWVNARLCFKDNFDKASAKITYKSITMSLDPGQQF